MAMMYCPGPWTREQQEEYIDANPMPEHECTTRICANNFLKFARKLFTEPCGRAVICSFEITDFAKSISLRTTRQAFIVATATGLLKNKHRRDVMKVSTGGSISKY